MLSLKYLKGNKKQTITLIIGIIFSSSLLFSFGILFSSFRNYLIDKVIMEGGNYHVKIVGNIDEDKNVSKIWVKNKTYYIRYDDIKDVYSNTKKMCKKNECLKIVYNIKLLSLYGMSDNNEIMSLFKSLIITFCFIFGTSSLFIIYNSFKISITKKRKDVALLKLSGLTNKDVFKIFLIESIIISLIGLILGFIISLILDKLIIKIINNLMSEALISKIKLDVYLPFIFIPLMFLIIIILISSIFPLFKIRKYKVMDIFRGNDISNKKINNHFKSFVLNYAFTNYQRAKKKYKSLIICIFSSALLFCSFLSIMNYTYKILDEYIKMPNYDLSVTTSSDDYDKLKRLTQNINSSKSVIFKSCVKEANIPSKYFTKNSKKINVLITNLGGNEIVNQVDEIIEKDDKMLKNKYKPYKNLKEITFGDIKISDLKLTDNIPFGFENNLTSDYMLLNLDNTNFEKVCLSYEGQAYLKTNKKNLDTFMNKYVKKHKFKEVTYTNIKKAISLTNNFLLLIKVFLLACLFLIVIILITSIFNIVSASINIRKKEFACLKCLGLINFNIIKCLFLESLFITFKGFFYALPFILIISKSLYVNLSNIFNVSLTIFDASTFLLDFLFTLLLVFICMIISHKSLYKKSLIYNLKNENF